MILGIHSATKQSDAKRHREPEGRGDLNEIVKQRPSRSLRNAERRERSAFASSLDCARDHPERGQRPSRRTLAMTLNLTTTCTGCALTSATEFVIKNS